MLVKSTEKYTNYDTIDFTVQYFWLNAATKTLTKFHIYTPKKHFKEYFNFIISYLDLKEIIVGLTN